MTDFFESETKLRATLESETLAADRVRDKLVAQANEARDKMVDAAQKVFDKSSQELTREWLAAREAETRDAVKRVNAEAGLDELGKPVKPTKPQKRNAA